MGKAMKFIKNAIRNVDDNPENINQIVRFALGSELYSNTVHCTVHVYSNIYTV